ncbi:MAG TPA: hypothetical protein VFV98_11165 [Vicinamibacterales bacterium]|nr:hypothetical protein [Vicinamibacterales bacterium]
MSSDLARARALLRLYPPAWRERYGDEFLELVAETGLTWSVVVDVILSAFAQRLRALLAMRRDERERLSDLRRGPLRPAGDVVLDVISFVALAGSVVTLFVMVGAPWPPWNFWCWLVLTGHTRFGMLSGGAGKRRADRVGRSFYFFLESVAIIGAVVLAAAWMRSRGVPGPPDRSDVLLVACGFAALARFAYGGCRSFSPTTTWSGISRVESRAWGLLALAGLFLGALAEPNMKMFWIMALFPFMVRGISHGCRPIDIERRRAAFELEQQRLREKFPVQHQST